MPADVRIDPLTAGPTLDGLSVVIPVCNEEPNVAPLADEVVAVLRGRVPFDLIFIDDGSTDRTVEVARATAFTVPELRLLRHSRRSGQSLAIVSGIRAARYEWVATLDGDGQNDPADIPVLVAAALAAPDVRLVVGNRVSRRDTRLRRLSSRVANGVRRRLLRDATPDTGCGIKLLHRATFLQLPVFDHMHRFLPALYQREGARVVSVAVTHRPRLRGRSKYGVLDRLWVGIVDIFGVRWLNSRYRAGLQVTEDARVSGEPS